MGLLQSERVERAHLDQDSGMPNRSQSASTSRQWTCRADSPEVVDITALGELAAHPIDFGAVGLIRQLKA